MSLIYTDRIYRSLLCPLQNLWILNGVTFTKKLFSNVPVGTANTGLVIDYRDLEEMMRKVGLAIDHTTLYQWVQHYAPELKKQLAWYNKLYANRWYLDETYINEVSFINQLFGIYG